MRNTRRRQRRQRRQRGGGLLSSLRQKVGLKFSFVPRKRKTEPPAGRALPALPASPPPVETRDATAPVTHVDNAPVTHVDNAPSPNKQAALMEQRARAVPVEQEAVSVELQETRPPSGGRRRLTRGRRRLTRGGKRSKRSKRRKNKTSCSS